MKCLWILALVAAVCGVANGEDMVLSPKGLGDVEIGTSTDQVERSLHQMFDGAYTSACEVVSSKRTARFGITYTIEANRLTRIDVDYFADSTEPLTIHTPEGIGLGSSEEDLIKVYGKRARVEQNPGDPTWHYIYVDNADHTGGLAFDTDGKKVKSMRTGEYPQLVSHPACGR